MHPTEPVLSGKMYANLENLEETNNFLAKYKLLS